MEEKNNLEDRKDKNKKLQEYYLIGRFLFIILLVVGVGVFAVNQSLEFKYRAEFLKAPCQLCKDLNTNQSKCIDNCFKFLIQLYPDGYGNWKDDKGKCYNSMGIEKNCTGNSIVSEPINISNILDLALTPS